MIDASIFRLSECAAGFAVLSRVSSRRDKEARSFTQQESFSSKKIVSQGFTLIELLVTTALSLILVAGGVAAFNQYHDREIQIQAGRQVISALEVAKKRASVGDKPDTQCGTLRGYRTRGVVNTDDYFVSILCTGNKELEEQSFQLPESRIFSKGFDVTFPAQPGTVATAPITVEIKKTGESQLYRFIIHPTGTIEDVGLITP